MKQKLLYSLIIIAYSLNNLGMSTNFFKPTTFVPKIRFANDTLFTIAPGYFKASSKSGYDHNGIKGHTFQWNKPETMLNSFIDESLPINDTTSPGKAYIDGKVIVHEFSFLCTKNIPNGLFFDIQLHQHRLVLKNISLIPLNNKLDPFSSEKIFESEDPTFFNYVQDFKDKYPLFKGKEKQVYSLNQTRLMAGYTKTFNHFRKIDFIDFTAKVGLELNIINTKNDFILALPLHKNNGFCIEASGLLGIYTWLNFGASFTAKAYTSFQQNIPLNTNSIDNDFLKPHQGEADLKQFPFYSGTIYVEADHLARGLSLLLGYSYSKQNKSAIKVINDVSFPSIDNSTPERYKGWESGTLLFDIEYDFATEKNRAAPSIKISLYKSIHGQNIFKSAAQGISCCLQFSKRF